MKTIFVNVDTLDDFMMKHGALYVPDAETIIGNLRNLTFYAGKHKTYVLNLADRHNGDSKEISSNPDFIETFPEHCMENTKGAEFIPATTPKSPYIIHWNQKLIDEQLVSSNRNAVLYKDNFDLFQGNPHTERVIDLLSPENAVVYGVAENVCVDYAVRGLSVRGIKVYVPLDAVKALPNIPEKAHTWNAVLTDTEAILKLLKEGKL